MVKCSISRTFFIFFILYTVSWQVKKRLCTCCVNRVRHDGKYPADKKECSLGFSILQSWWCSWPVFFSQRHNGSLWSRFPSPDPFMAKQEPKQHSKYHITCFVCFYLKWYFVCLTNCRIGDFANFLEKTLRHKPYHLLCCNSLCWLVNRC